jgi:hypothetical protein
MWLHYTPNTNSETRTLAVGAASLSARQSLTGSNGIMRVVKFLPVNVMERKLLA